MEQQSMELSIKEDNPVAMSGYHRLIDQVVEAGNIEMLREVLELQKAWEENEAEKSFNRDRALAQAEMPPIKKTKSVKSKSGSVVYNYASLDDVNKIIQPIYTKYNFSVSYNEDDDKVYATLHHKDGHSETIQIKANVQGATSMTNSIQQVGSRMSYCRRYLLAMLFNLTFEGEDDDGVASNHKLIGHDKILEIRGLLERANVKESVLLEKLNSGALQDLYEHEAEHAINVLKTKISQKDNNNE